MCGVLCMNVGGAMHGCGGCSTLSPYCSQRFPAAGMLFQEKHPRCRKSMDKLPCFPEAAKLGEIDPDRPQTSGNECCAALISHTSATNA